VPLTMFGTRPGSGGKDAMPPRGAVLDLVYGAPYRVERTPWPRTSSLAQATSDRLHARMLEELAAGLALTGQTMPGPIPGKQPEPVKELL
jgi:1-acyl-sn-glycerol-3-phosphate acyltransferase